MASDTNDPFKKRTVTVDELINRLQQFVKNMSVVYAWDSEITPVRLDCIQIESLDLEEFPRNLIVLDAGT